MNLGIDISLLELTLEKSKIDLIVFKRIAMSRQSFISDIKNIILELFFPFELVSARNLS